MAEARAAEKHRTIKAVNKTNNSMHGHSSFGSRCGGSRRRGERNVILLREIGNGDPRRVPMVSELRTLLETIKASRPFDKPDSPVLAVNEAQKSIDSTARRAGISHLTHHDLRHLCATMLIERGIDIPTVARLLGHKDGGTPAMRTYGHLRDEHAQKVMARVSYSDQTFSNLVSMAEASQRKER